LAVTLAAALLALPLALPLQADDGDLDPTFDGGAFTLGWVAGHARATVLEPLADGELLVGGVVGDGPGESDGWAVAKLAADGSREIGWSINFQIVSAGDETMATNGYLYDMRRNASDRTYLAGAAEAGIGNEVPMLARLAPNGALDDSFDDNGLLVITDMPAAWDEIETGAAEILSDGRSVFTGSCNFCPNDGETWVWVTRRLADGAPDLSFSGDGWQTFRFSDDDESRPTSVAVDEGGRILVGGEVSFVVSESFLARLTALGNLDGGFGGGDGIAGPLEARPARTLALDPSTGRIAGGGGSPGFPRFGFVIVFTPSGAPDTTFSGDGYVDLDLEEGTSILGLAFQSDGKLLAAGAIDANGANEGGFFLARMTTGGGLDGTFDDNGVKRVEFDAAPNVFDRAFAVTTMGGRLVAAGYAGEGGGQEEEMAVVRTQNAQIFSDGFERGSVGGWSGF
jgi:uncharacterized delta-60 repeat protein